MENIWPVFYSTIGGIIVGLVSFIIQRKYRQDDLKEIESMRSELTRDRELLLMQFRTLSETRFKLYSELWSHLTDLEYKVDDLWSNGVSATKIKTLSKSVKELEKKIKESILVIDRDHLNRLNSIISNLKNFQVSKQKLLEIDEVDEFTSREIQRLIDRNFQLFTQYSELKMEILHSMQLKLGIEI